jgi:hypothetical protein
MNSSGSMKPSLNIDLFASENLTTNNRNKFKLENKLVDVISPKGNFVFKSSLNNKTITTTTKTSTKGGLSGRGTSSGAEKDIKRSNSKIN